MDRMRHRYQSVTFLVLIQEMGYIRRESAQAEVKQ